MRVKQSEWRLINAQATIGENFNGAVLLPIFPIFFISLVTHQMWMNYFSIGLLILEFTKLKFKLLTLGDLYKYIFFKFIAGHYWHGFRRVAYSSLTCLAGAMIMFTPLNAEAGFTVIKPKQEIVKPNTVDSFSNEAKVLGGEFIDNTTKIKGAGPAVDLELLLKQVVPSVYSIEFKSVEIASVKINWKSTNWTPDQVLGNIAIRYGIMFETMQGSSVISVDWFDKNKCETQGKKLFKRLCGSTDGFFID